uniref:Putative serine/threonine-protein kinase kinx n=1 Tax=Anopheles triannulatus TaxID=58253 RepID=A0A2M4A9X5_9DIPT
MLVDTRLSNSMEEKKPDLPDGLILVSDDSQEELSDEHEEGEIPDDEDESDDGHAGTQNAKQHQLPPARNELLEDISSEEESTIRERLAQLVAMDKEIRMIKQMSEYGYLGHKRLQGKENIFYDPYYDEQPSSRRRKPVIESKSSSRRESKRSSAVVQKRQNEKPKDKSSKHDRKVNGHKRHKKRKYESSLSPSPVRRSALLESSDSEYELDSYARQHLACSIDNGRRRKLSTNENALKRKLRLQEQQQQLRGQKPKKRKSVTVDEEPMVLSSGSENGSPEPPIVIVGDDDDDDDADEEELQLRLLALQTKPIVKDGLLDDTIDRYQIPSPPPPPSMGEDEESDKETSFQSRERYASEERELRMIALKSAYTKKHEARLRRKVKDSERPYSPSDNIVLSPVHEPPPPYDELDNDLYSIEGSADERSQLIDLNDTDDNGNDMEISPVRSPVAWPLRMGEREEGLDGDSQHPIDMELASSEQSSEPVYMDDETANETVDFDQQQYQQKSPLIGQSPPMTPDSMGEAEEEALRHLLLSKMRQKKVTTKSPSPTDVTQPSMENSLDVPMDLEGQESNAAGPVAEHEQLEPTAKDAVVNVKIDSASQTTTQNPNLIVVVDHKVRRGRKKSQTAVAASGTVSATSIQATRAKNVPPGPAATVAVPTIVRTQKLLNNRNKLINLNHTISSSPTPPASLAIMRTDSPKELGNIETFVSKPVSKMVIQLGHSDSDSDVDFGSPKSRKTSDASRATSNTTSPECIGNTSKPGTEFELQLDRFLRSVRNKTTSSNGASNGGAPTTDAKVRKHSGASLEGFTDGRAKHPAGKSQPVTIPATVASSTAVKHLPKSAQMEYTKLLARMAQLEAQKQARHRQLHKTKPSNDTKANDGLPSDAVKSKQIDNLPSDDVVSSVGNAVDDRAKQGPTVVPSPGKRKVAAAAVGTQAAQAIEENGTEEQDPVLRKLNQIRNRLPTLSDQGKSRLLITTEKHLEKHSNIFLRQLEKHNATLSAVQEERRNLYQLENRIELLRERLAMLERTRDQMRAQSMESFGSMQSSHRKIVADRKRSIELRKVCIDIGRVILDESYVPPSTPSDDLLQEQWRILVKETKQLKDIRKPTMQEYKEELIARNRQALMISERWRDSSGGVAGGEEENRVETVAEKTEPTPEPYPHTSDVTIAPCDKPAHLPPEALGKASAMHAPIEEPTEQMELAPVVATTHETATTTEMTASDDPSNSDSISLTNEQQSAEAKEEKVIIVRKEPTDQEQLIDKETKECNGGKEEDEAFTSVMNHPFTQYSSPLVSFKQQG